MAESNNAAKRLPAGKEPYLFDGSMGTLYAKKTGQPAWAADLAVVEDPETIIAIHKEYVEAGAQALKTATFSLSEKTQSHDIPKLVHAAVNCARQACQSTEQPISIFGDLGPLPDNLNAMDVYPPILEAFLQEGVTNFLFETLPDFEGMAEVFAWLKKRQPQSFVLASFSCGADGLSRKGRPAKELLGQAEACEDVDAVGLNCLCGPSHMAALVRSLPDFTKPLSIMPNAGYPRITSRAAVYDGSPEYFARNMEAIYHQGAVILGGCCGTEPAHIQTLAKRLQEHEKRPRKQKGSMDLAADEQTEDLSFEMEEKKPNRPKTEPDILCERKAQGRKAILVELDPPASDQIAAFLEGSSRLQAAGADLLTIADNPIGRPRADSSLLACKVKRELGMECLPHMNCRDRNLNATKALLLALSMEDVHQVLLVTGDPLPAESRDEVKAVFSFNSRTLAGYVKTLEEEGACQPFHIYGALDVNARNFDVQLRLAKLKEEAGMEGFLSQPIYSKRALDNLKKARMALKGRIYAGLMPIVSWRNACFLKNEISGMDIPDALALRYKDKNREECEAISLDFCAEMAGQMKDDCDGFYLMTPFSRISLMERLIQILKTMDPTEEARTK